MRMSLRPSSLLSRVLLAALAVGISTGSVAAQDNTSGTANTQNTQTAAPAANTPSAQAPASTANRNFSSDEYVPNKWEIFGGYSWIAPNGRVGDFQLDKHINPGFALSGAYYVNKYLGGEILGSYHNGDRETMSSITAGPIVRFPMAGLSPFIHATLGGSRLAPSGLGSNWGFGTAMGGGLDLAIPSWTHVKFRLIQADYEYSHHNFFPITPRPNLGSAQLSTGIVYTAVPLTPPIPPTISCAVNPTEVFPGEPVNVTVTPSNFNPKRTVTYSYQTNGGKVSGTGPTTTIDTTGTAPGSYNLTATATDGHMKVPASCNAAAYTVKEWPAPQVTCSANPSEIDPGQSAAISANGSTIRGGLKYSYSATSGTIEGTGPNATYSSAGAQPGTSTVTCTVTDDRGKTASAQTTVTIRAPVAPPPPPPPPQASKINEIAFTKPYSPRVDNTAKAILDDVALRLQREPDSKAVVVGETDAKETGRRAKNLAAMRAVNTKAYLVNEKGIDPSRIETRTDGTAGAKSEIWIVPNGATFTQPDTQVVDLPTPKAAPARRARRAPKAAAH
jgi:outer membrane protein OmpA-like peptidoglycan-associated protein